MTSSNASPLEATELFLRPEFLNDPYPAYRELREGDPVHRSKAGFWVLSSFADVASLQVDPRFGSDFTKADGSAALATAAWGDPESAVGRYQRDVFVFKDDPEHRRLRDLVSRSFTVRRVEALRPRIEGIVDALLDEMRGEDEVNLLERLAFPLSVTMICELLGVPEVDRRAVRERANLIGRAFGPRPEDDVVNHVNDAIDASNRYFEELLRSRRNEPRDDVLSGMAAAEEDGDRLTSREVIATANLLFGAGHDTTANLIGNGVYWLLRNPEQRRRLSDDPGLIEPGVEEMLRYDAPFQFMRKVALEDVQVRDRTIPKGALTLGLIGSGNRDPARFADPDRFDVTRKDQDLLSFGRGMHLCLGHRLARIEAQIAIGRLLERYPRIALASDHATWRSGRGARGLTTLPVRIT